MIINNQGGNEQKRGKTINYRDQKEKEKLRE